MQDFFFLKRLHLNYLSKMDLVLPKNGNKAIEKPFFFKSLSQTVSQLVRNILRDIVVVEAVYLVTLWLGTKWHIDQSVARKYINSWWVDVSFKFLAWILASKSNHVCMMGWPSHEEIQLSAIRPVVVAQQKHSFDLRNLFYLLVVAPPPREIFRIRLKINDLAKPEKFN